MKSRIILCLALVLSGFSLSSDQVRAEDRIWVDGKINGQSVRLVFDTGTSGPLLFKKSAERLGLKFTLPTDATPASPSNVVVGSTEICEFSLSGDIHKMSFGVFDLPDFVSDPDKTDGILGWGALGSDIFLIDASQGKMGALAVLPEEVKAWQQFRVQTNTDILILEIPGNRNTNTILVDTGKNDGIALAPKEWQAWKTAHPTQRLTLKARYMPAAGVFVREEAWADKISFGPLVLTDVPISEAHATEGHSSSKATFGMAALKRLEPLVVDGIKGIAYMNAKRQPPTPYEHNRLGAVFVPNDPEKNNDLVAHVVVGSPAQKAGIQDGDILLKVGDVDVTIWRTDRSIAARNFWEQPKGTEHRLTLQRGQKTNETTVMLENILGPDKP